MCCSCFDSQHKFAMQKKLINKKACFQTASPALPRMKFPSVTIAAVPTSKNSWEKWKQSYYLADYDLLEQCPDYLQRG